MKNAAYFPVSEAHLSSSTIQKSNEYVKLNYQME